MKEITEQQILSLAPNATAASNGRKISQKGGFVRLERAADDTFYMGECSGSGKSNYITTADFVDPLSPVFRCSCPSRQFPCKHSLALLYEIMAQKSFTLCEIPGDILKKREKKQAREERAKEKAENAATEDGTAAAAKKKAPSKAGKAARTKKIKKQLEGLELADRLMRELMTNGLGAMGGTALTSYRQLSKQMGDYYLPGIQRLLNGLILEIETLQKDGDESHYEAAVDLMKRLGSLIRKSQKYLTEKLESDSVEQDDSPLYEELGGVWKLSELAALGHGRKDRQLIQTAFWVSYDEAGKQYIDTGIFVDLEDGTISKTCNYRPLKAVKYIKQEDTLFGVAQIPEAAYYPGEGNVRVRWDGAQIRAVEKEDLAKLRSFAAVSLAAESKQAKNLLKNALSDPMLLRLISYAQIGRTKLGLTLRTPEGETILLGDMPGMEPTVMRLLLLPDGGLLYNQTLLGAFYYDQEAGRLLMQPVSIITETDIVRLLY
ncbi:SWIM zinc finger family protein [Lachnospiraceae bacterium JLR.KK008]